LGSRQSGGRSVAVAIAIAVAIPTTARADEGAKTKLAALILKTGDVDQDLADNLTEVLIARLAESRSGVALVGKEQLRARMGQDERRALACIEDVACLGHIGVELGVTRIVVGTLGRRGGDYLYNLNLVDITTGKVENRIFQLVAGKVDALIAAVQNTAATLFTPRVEPGAIRVVAEKNRGAFVYLDDAFVGSTPLRRDGIEPGPHTLRVEKEGHRGWSNELEVPAGSTLDITVPLASLPERRRWPAAAVVAAAGTGVAAELFGLVLGVLSQQTPPEGQTRVMALLDADRRSNLALAANTLFIAGAVAGLVAVGTLVLFRQDVFGVRTEGRF
jgi:hypothetical protein